MARKTITSRYNIVRPLGEGGMGEVFLVEDLWDRNRQVALKKLRREILSDTTREFFIREFTALKQLRHPHIASVYDFGYTPQGDPFFTSEYCEGSDLITATAEMGFGERVERAVEICRALAYIHSRGYVHADIKPENIIVLAPAHPGEARLKLLDFGLARHVSEQSRGRLSGTLVYLAPEVVKGRPLDARADLFSLGVVLYQLFTRQLPFGEIDPQVLIDMLLSVTPAPPTEKDGTLPVAVDSIVLRLLNKNPEDRFPSSQDVIDAFNRELGYNFEVETHEAARDYVRSGRFVGRKDEQRRLSARLSTLLKHGTGSLLMVAGESGVGKTRLLEEFKVQAQLEGVRTFSSAASEKIRQPLQCFQDIMRPIILGAQEPGSPKKSLLEKYEAPLKKIFPDLFEFSGPLGTEPAPSSSEKELLLESLALFLLEACAEDPSLLLIQDIHWADALSIELIQRLSRSLASRRMILAATLRSDEIAGSALDPSLPVLREMETTEFIDLKPLSQEDVAELVGSTLDIEKTPSSVVSKLLQKTNGNPFFIQEVLWVWMEEKVIQPRMKEWRAEPTEIDSLDIPASMATVFLRRIKSLNVSQRRLLQVIALFNCPVTISNLSTVLHESTSSLEPMLNILVESAVLVRSDSRGTSEFSFRHGQMKDSIESEVDAVAAAHIHLQIAEFYENDALVSHVDHSVVLAFHFAAAGDAKKTRLYSIRAGDKLRRLFAYEEAIRAYGLAEKFSEAGDHRLLEIREKTAFCHFQLVHLDEAETIYRSLLNEGSDRLTPVRAAKLHLHLSRIAEYRGHYPKAMEINNQGLQLIQAVPEAKTKAELLARISFEYYRLSDYRKASEYIQQAVELVEHLENFPGLGEIFNEKFIVHYSLGEIQAALEAAHRAISVYSKFGWGRGVAGVTGNLGIIYQDYLHDYAKAFECYRRSLQLREKIFDRRGIEQIYINLSSVHSLIGEYSMALEYLDQAEVLNREMPEQHIEMTIALDRGENLTGLGEFEKAWGLLNKALALAEESQNQTQLIYVLLKLAEHQERLGKFEAAQSYAERAANLAVKTAGSLEQMIARIGFGRIAIDRELWDAADQSLREALDRAKQLHHQDGFLQGMLLRAQADMEREKLKSCEAILTEVKPLSDSTQNHLLRARFYLLRGRLTFLRSGSFDPSGSDDLHQALREAEKTQDSDLIVEAHHRLSQWHAKCGDTANAVLHHRQALTIMNSIADRLSEELKKNYLENRYRAAIFKETGPTVKETGAATMVITRENSSSLSRNQYSVTLFQISKLVNSIFNLNELLEQVMDLVLESIRVERGLILLVNEDSGDLEVKVARNISKETIEDATAISKTVLAEVVEVGRPLISVNALNDERLRERRSIVDFGIGMVLCIPLSVKKKTIGAVYIDNPIATLPFNEEDVNFLMAFTNLFSIAIENARLYEKLHQENIYLRNEVRGKYTYENIIGRSPKMMELFRRLDNVVNSSANVLIYGESGTGKELIARAIHYNGNRKEKRFIAIDCGSIPENLIESELFGYKKGAFTGAMFDKKGLFEEADGGTVFLDEITNTSRTLQAKLLRVLQEREIRRVGDAVDRHVDVRLIAASNRDLKQMVQAGEFREDLYYRLSVLNLHVPALRERGDDIPLLANHILKRLSQENPSITKIVSQSVMRRLMNYAFPGNVRELENLVESAFFLAQGKEVQLHDFPPEVIGEPRPSPDVQSRKQPLPAAKEKPSISSPVSLSYKDEEGDAEQLYRKMKEEGISFWKAVKEPFMRRELSKELVREIIKHGLQDSRGRYRDLMTLFHLEDSDYTVFMNFLRKHGCQVDYRPYRQQAPSRPHHASTSQN